MSNILENGYDDEADVERAETISEINRSLIKARRKANSSLLLETRLEAKQELSELKAQLETLYTGELREELQRIDTKISKAVGDTSRALRALGEKDPTVKAVHVSEDDHTNIGRAHSGIKALTKAAKTAHDRLTTESVSFAANLLVGGLKALRGDDTYEQQARVARDFQHALSIFDDKRLFDGKSLKDIGIEPDTIYKMALAANTDELTLAERYFVEVLQGEIKVSDLTKKDSVLRHSAADLLAGAHAGLAYIYKIQLDRGEDLEGRKLKPEGIAELEAGLVHHVYQQDVAPEKQAPFAEVSRTSAISNLFHEQASWTESHAREIVLEKAAEKLERTRDAAVAEAEQRVATEFLHQKPTGIVGHLKAYLQDRRERKAAKKQRANGAVSFESEEPRTDSKRVVRKRGLVERTEAVKAGANGAAKETTVARTKRNLNGHDPEGFPPVRDHRMDKTVIAGAQPNGLDRA
jgi:hypothetical protein